MRGAWLAPDQFESFGARVHQEAPTTIAANCRVFSQVLNCSHRKRCIPMDPEARQAQGPCRMPSFPLPSKLCTSKSVRERIFTRIVPSYLHVPPSITVLWEWRRLFITRICCSICFSSLSSSRYPRSPVFRTVRSIRMFGLWVCPSQTLTTGWREQSVIPTSTDRL